MPSQQPVTKVVKKFGKKGQTREVVRPRAPRYYPGDNVLPQRKFTKQVPTAPKTRRSITPGTVLILLAGRFRGRRVVYLKTLASGLLLISGPIKVNGVPLRRVNQRYVIATSTRVDISSVDVPAHIDDVYFKKDKAAKKQKTADSFFVKDDQKSAKKEIPEGRKADQKAIDTGLLAAIKASSNPLLRKYLTARFSLSAGEYVHQLRF